ncbi:MAG: transposase [Melioribacteraceae bacterium]
MFRLQRMPLHIELLLTGLQQFFNDYQWMHFKSILLALLITPYKATLNGMVKVLSFGSHRSKHNEFFNDCSSILSKVLKFYSMLILQLLRKSKEAIYFIIDDTTNKKRGKHILAAFSFFDHTSKQYIWGQQLVCAIIEYRGIVIPFAIEVYIPQDKAIEIGSTFKKKTMIASEILKEFEADENQEVFVVADTYYASPSIMGLCRQRKYSFVSMLKTNRILYINNKQINVASYSKRLFSRKKSNRVIKIGSKKYQVDSQKVVLKSGGAVRIVCTRVLSHCTVKTLFTTNPALPIESILTAYSRRWSIEVFFKMSKQYLGLRSYQNRNLTAIQSAVRLSLISYNLLTHVYIEEIRAQGKRITEKNLARFSVLTTRDRLRQLAMIDSMDYCLEQNINKSKNMVIKEIKHMLLAA